MTATTRYASNLIGARVHRPLGPRDLLAQRGRVGEALLAVLGDHLEDDRVDRRRDADRRSSRDGGGGSCFMWKLMMSIGVLALAKGSLPVSISYAIMPSA